MAYEGSLLRARRCEEELAVKEGLPIEVVEFHELTVELCKRYKHVNHAIRAQALIVAALAMVDAASNEARKGVCVTETEFLWLCRRFFRKARGLPQEKT